MLYQFFIEANEKDNKVSARGLMLIFLIGVIPILLGIDFESVQIELNWLKGFEVKHKERISLIYAALIIYSLFRFRLANQELAQHCNLRSIGWFFSNQKLGKKIANILVFKKDIYDGVSFEDNSEKTKVIFYANYDPDIPGYPQDKLVLSYNKDGRLCSHVSHGDSETYSSLGLSKMWNVDYDQDAFFQPNDQYGQQIVSNKSKVSDVRLIFILSAGAFLFSFKSMYKDLNCLDYYLPIYCNVGLAVYLIGRYFFW